MMFAFNCWAEENYLKFTGICLQARHLSVCETHYWDGGGQALVQTWLSTSNALRSGDDTYALMNLVTKLFWLSVYLMLSIQLM